MTDLEEALDVIRNAIILMEQDKDYVGAYYELLNFVAQYDQPKGDCCG